MASLLDLGPFRAVEQVAGPPPPALKGTLGVDEMMAAFGLTRAPVEDDDDEMDDVDEDDEDEENVDESTAHAPSAATAQHKLPTEYKAQRTLSKPAPKPAANADKVRPASSSWADGPPTKRRRSEAVQSGPRFRKWPPYSREEPYTDTPTGLRVYFPLFNDEHRDPGLIGDLPAKDVRAAVERILEINQTVQGNHNYALNDVERAKLEHLVGLLPLELVQSPPAGAVAFQPLTGTRLNAEIADKERQALPYYYYLHESFFERREDADSFLDFAASDDALAEADDAGQARKYEAWLVGLRKFGDKGGWDGHFQRVTSYSGESDGWDVPVDEDESLSARVFSHLVGPDAASQLSLHKIQLRTLSKFLEANPGVKSLSTVSFLCTAADLDPSVFSAVDVKALEALISVLRYSPTDWGGSNVSSCGRVDHAADILKTVASFEPNTPISALRELDEVPKSLSLGLIAKFVPDTTCDEAKACLINSQEPGHRRRRSSDSTDVVSTRSLTKPLFASGGHAALDLSLSSTLVRRLHDQYRDSGPRLDLRLRDEDAEALAPFRNKSFYPALYSLSIAAKKPLPRVVTKANIRTGVELDMVAYSTRDVRGRRIRFVLAHGKRAAVGELFFYSEERVGAVTLEFDEEWQTVSLMRSGEVLVVYERAGSTVAEYDVPEFMSRTRAPHSGGKEVTDEKRRKKTEERKAALDDLWEAALSG